MKHKIFVVDDHPVMRKGYRFLIEQEPDLMVCGEAGTALDALDAIEEVHPDLVLVDISLGGMSGLELVKSLHTRDADLAMLVISMHDESLYAQRALLAGARGYIMKNEADTAVIEGIRQVLRGGFYLSEAISTRILLQYQQRGTLPAQHNDDPLERLSDRELDVFELMGQGNTTKQIAEALLISPKTVESHRGRIKSKLAIASTSQLVQRATLWVDGHP